MQEFGQRLRERAQELGLTDAEVARRIGISPRRYGNYVTNEREPDLDLLVQIARVLGTTPNWLLGLQSDRPPPPLVVRGDGSAVIEFLGDEFAAIPVLNVEASAGPGREVDSLDVLHRIMFRLDWLQSVTNTGLDNLAVIKIDGDSMEPTLRSGDTALIDRSQTSPLRKDGLYALWRDGGLQVKRVSADWSRGLLTIKSDNPEYPTYSDVPPSDVDIKGRVIWIGRRC